MTTIAYRDGVLAADSLGCRGSVKVDGTHKLQRAGDAVIGFAGNSQDGHAFAQWWRTGRDMGNLPTLRPYACGGDDNPDFSAIVLTPGGVEEWNEWFLPLPIVGPFFAIGSGAMAATAAMHMGADAIEAVRVAALVDINTGGEIMAMWLTDTSQ